MSGDDRRAGRSPQSADPFGEGLQSADPFGDDPQIPQSGARPETSAGHVGARADSTSAPTPADPARRRAGLRWIGVGLAVAILFGAAVVTLPLLRPAAQPPPRPVFIPPTGAAPASTPAADFTDQLIDHRFDTASLGPWSCAVSVTAPATEPALRSWVDAVVDCLDRRFRGPIERAGFVPSSPRRTFFTARVSTPCGPSTAPAFYCSADETIYLDPEQIAGYAETMRLGSLHVIFHEYAHHVQQRLGIMRAANDFGPDRGRRTITLRRLELQADCIYVSSLRRLEQVQWRARDTTELMTWRSGAGDRTHGEADTQRRWLTRGIDQAEMSVCNTWRADESEVR